MKSIQGSKKSLKQMVIEEIKRYIIEHELTAGDKLPTERAFTELFGVSRSVVREALSYLENIGIVRIRQGQGAFLKETNIEELLDSFFFLWQINKPNIREILGLRVISECSAIDDIVSQGNNEVISKLKNVVKLMEESEDPKVWKQADIDFHQLILKETNNDLFIQMTNIVTNYFFQVEHINLTKEEYGQLVSEHKQIIEALEKNDAMKAKEILTKHINRAKV